MLSYMKSSHFIPVNKFYTLAFNNYPQNKEQYHKTIVTFLNNEILGNINDNHQINPFLSFVCLCWSFTAQSTTRSCRAGQLIVALFLGRPSKRLTSAKRGRPRQ